MIDQTSNATGWKPIPPPLKALSVVMVLWAVGSVMNLPNLMANGLPFFGVFLFGTMALLVVLFLDFIGPFVFLYALWNRKTWTAKWAFFYLGIFILNGVVALFIFRQQLGVLQILIPTLAGVAFFAVIYRNKSYFDHAA